MKSSISMVNTQFSLGITEGKNREKKKDEKQHRECIHFCVENYSYILCSSETGVVAHTLMSAPRR